jgi:Predicted ATP-dependent serine protease
LAIISSLLNRVVDNKTIVLGEVGLGGEVRSVPKLADRLKEAEKLGFTRAIIPDAKIPASKMKITKIKSVLDLISI